MSPVHVRVALSIQLGSSALHTKKRQLTVPLHAIWWLMRQEGIIVAVAEIMRKVLWNGRRNNVPPSMMDAAQGTLGLSSLKIVNSRAERPTPMPCRNFTTSSFIFGGQQRNISHTNLPCRSSTTPQSHWRRPLVLWGMHRIESRPKIHFLSGKDYSIVASRIGFI